MSEEYYRVKLKDMYVEENVYIGETSIQIGQHGFIDQPKEIIEYIKYLQKENEELKKILEKLNNIIDELEQENAVLKTLVVNEDNYIYGIR